MAEDKNTMIYLAGGGLLIALMFAMSKKASASTGGGSNLGDRLPDSNRPPDRGRVVLAVPPKPRYKYDPNVTPVTPAPPTQDAPPSTDTTLYAFVEISSGTLRVRSAPNTTSSIVGNLQDGDRVDIADIAVGETVLHSNSWYQIVRPHAGYVSAAYFNKVYSS